MNLSQKYSKYMVTCLEKIVNIPSPTGFTYKALEFISDTLKNMGYKTYRLLNDALYIRIKGKNSKKAFALAAHVDTLGAMVKGIKSNGSLKVAKIGYFSWLGFIGEYCTVFNNNEKEYRGTLLPCKISSHIYSQKVIENIKFKNEEFELRLDLKINSEKELKKYEIDTGNFIAFDPNFEYTSTHFIKSRFLDDKSCVAILLTLAKFITDKKIVPENDIYLLFTGKEETGFGAGVKISEKITEFLSLDIAPVGADENNSEYSVSICAMDGSGPYDYKVNQKLINLCKKNKINYNIEIFSHYNSDGYSVRHAGHNVKLALIGPGVSATHAFERTHLTGMVNTLKLAIAYIMSA